MEHMQNEEKKVTELKDNSNRSKQAINILWIICILNLIGVISTYFEFQLLTRIRDGYDFSEQEALANDLRQGLIGIFQFIAQITSIVLFLNWFRRAYGNLHRIGTSSLEYSETMAIWGFIIPFVNLYRPYKIAKEIAVETKNKVVEIVPDHEPSFNSSIIGFWWAMFLLTGFVANIAFRLFQQDDTIEQVIISTQTYMLADLIDLIAAIVTIIMIKEISRYELLLFDNLKNGANMV